MAYQTGNLIKAVFDKLWADITLKALTSEIYVSQLPSNAVYPCIVVGSDIIPSVPLNVFGKKGRTTMFPVTVYDNTRNVDSIIPIAERIDTILDWQSLTVANNSHIVTAIRDDVLRLDINNSELDKLTEIRLNYKIETQES
jgi:hypothetical protein